MIFSQAQIHYMYDCTYWTPLPTFLKYRGRRYYYRLGQSYCSETMKLSTRVSIGDSVVCVVARS